MSLISSSDDRLSSFDDLYLKLNCLVLPDEFIWNIICLASAYLGVALFVDSYFVFVRFVLISILFLSTGLKEDNYIFN